MTDKEKWEKMGRHAKWQNESGNIGEYTDAILYAARRLERAEELAKASREYINDIDNGLVSGCHDRRERLRYRLRAALARYEEGK